MHWCIKVLCLFISTTWLALAADSGGNTIPLDNKYLQKKTSIINFNFDRFADNNNNNKPQKITKKPSIVTFNFEASTKKAPEVPKRKKSTNEKNALRRKTKSIKKNSKTASTEFIKNPLTRTLSEKKLTSSSLGDQQNLNNTKKIPVNGNTVMSNNEIEVDEKTPVRPYAIYQKTEDNRESSNEFSTRWDPNYKPITKILQKINLETKTGQVIELLFNGVEGGNLVVVENAYLELLKHGYDISALAYYGMSPSSAAQKYGHAQMAKYLEKIEKGFSNNNKESLTNSEKVKVLESIMKINQMERQQIEKISFEKNYDLVLYIDDWGIDQITDFNFSCDIFRMLTALKTTEKVLKIKPPDNSIFKKITNTEKTHIYKFKKYYLFEFYKQMVQVTREQEKEKLAELEKLVANEKLVQMTKLLEDPELIKARELIDDSSKWKDRTSMARKLAIVEELLVKNETITEYLSLMKQNAEKMLEESEKNCQEKFSLLKKLVNDEKQEISSILENARELLKDDSLSRGECAQLIKKRLTAESQIKNLSIIKDLLNDEEFIKKVEALSDIEITVPYSIGKIFVAEEKIISAKEFLKRNELEEAAKMRSEVEEDFPVYEITTEGATWEKLWGPLDQKMSETFAWDKFGLFKDDFVNEFRQAIKDVFDLLIINEKKDIKSREKFKDESINLDVLWFLLDKKKLLSDLPSDDMPAQQDKGLSKQKMLFNNVVLYDRNFLQSFKMRHRDLGQQKRLLRFALKDNNWHFINKKKLLNQLFFPIPHDSIAKNLFLNRPLFFLDEEFNDLF